MWHILCFSSKGFSNLNITKKLANENSVLNFTDYLTEVNALMFVFKTHKNKLEK